MSLASSSNTELSALEKSPTFAMSLGAKELFHTNFLAFLLESEDSTFRGIQLAIREALSWPPASEVSRCAVWREKGDLDLVLVDLRAETPAEKAGREKEEGNGGGESRSERDEKEAKDDDWDWSIEGGWQRGGSQSNSAYPCEDHAVKSTGQSPNAASGSRLVPSGRVLVLEAKLKSVPGLEQLETYDRYLNDRLVDGLGRQKLARSRPCHAAPIYLVYPEEDVIDGWKLALGGKPPKKWGNKKHCEFTTSQVERRLISVAGDTMSTKTQVKEGDRTTIQESDWKGVAWRQLHSRMKMASSTLAAHPTCATLSDYVDQLGRLITLVERVHDLCKGARAKDIPYGAMRSQALSPAFRSMRISDLLGKALFANWLRDGVMPKVHDADLGPPGDWKLNSYVHYSNGTPGLGVEFVNDSFSISRTDLGSSTRTAIGIQVQAAEFRLYIGALKQTGAEEWIKSNSSINLVEKWFQVPVFGDSPTGNRGPVMPPPANSSRPTNLKKFAEWFYSAVRIDNKPVDKVEDEIVRLLQYACIEVVPLLR